MATTGSSVSAKEYETRPSRRGCRSVTVSPTTTFRSAAAFSVRIEWPGAGILVDTGRIYTMYRQEDREIVVALDAKASARVGKLSG